MNTVRFFRLPRPVAALALAIALSLPCLAHAINIGEAVLQSRLGEPLHVRVELMLGAKETVDDSCLSLAAPDPNDDDIRDYLTKATLAVKTQGTQRYAVISSHTAFNQPFARIRLQVKCSGMGSVTKTLTVLPDLDESVLPAPVSAPAIPATTNNTAPPPDTADMTSASVPRHARSDVSGTAAKPGKKQHAQPAQIARRKPGPSSLFRLKLSGDPIDESRIGKVSPEEREILLARQKMLDADDQMASLLSLQHEVKQLQSELGEIKLKLSQFDGAASQPSRTSAEKPAAALKQTAPEQADSPDLQQRRLLAVLGLLLAVLALWQVLRRYNMIKSRQAAAPILKHPGKISSATPLIAPGTAMPAPSHPANSAGTQASARPKPDIASQPLPPNKNDDKLVEEKSMLEEAELYAIHGHPNKAIEILNEIVARNPSHSEAWLLLLSILSSLGKTEDFEKAARNFSRHGQMSDAWKIAQALGRTLDQNNPLYAGEDRLGGAAIFMPQIALNQRRPVGDILVEMGVLDEQDMKACLANFDPKVHGRFGGYLISRKLVTHAQLHEALLHQQGISTEGGPGAMPTLQDMENFLANYDPKQHGSIGEYLVSHNAITPAQLNQVLKQQSNTNVAESAPQPDAAPAVENMTLDFELVSPTGKTPALDFDITEKNQALNFDLPQFTEKSQPPNPKPATIFPAFPDIDLSLPDKKPETK